MKKKIISILTAVLLVFAQAEGLLAAILPNNSVVVNTPTVNNHASGTPVVDIAAPNSKGLSHNKYDEFNVEARGVVLNNSLSGAVSEILGESIAGNVNFTDRVASVILNEILSGARSEINGAVEIAGEKAVLIMANPYGISVNGGSFINTEKAMLVTGIPNIVDETIKSFKLSTLAMVEVSGAGLKTKGALEIVSRYTKISGEMKAKSIEIKAGNKEYVLNEGTGEWEIISEEINDNAVDKYAVSAWAFGSMYGNRISIVSTEKGFGVKTAEGANLISDARDIEIRADGEVEIAGNIVSKRDILLKSEEKVIVTGDITGGLAATETEEAVGGNLKIEAAGTFKNRGKAIVEGNIEIESANIDNEGEVKGKKVTIKAEGFENRETGKIESIEEMTIKAERFRNGATVQGKNIKIEALEVENLLAGKIVSTLNTQMEAGAINNAGLINVGRELEISASGAMITTGLINVTENMKMVLGGSFSNAFNIFAKKIEIKAAKIKNESGTMKAEENIKLETDSIENESGRINAGLDLGIKFNTETDFNSRGGYNAGGKLSFTGIKNFVNASELVAGAIEIKLSETFTNQSSLITLGDMIISAGLINNENGLLRAGNNLTLTGLELINEKSSAVGIGEIAGKNLRLNIEKEVSNKSGKMSAIETMQMNAKSIINESSRVYGQGTISGGDVNIEALKVENKSGTVKATGGLEIKTDMMINRREESGGMYLANSVISANSLTIIPKSGSLATTILNENSSIRAGTNLKLWADNIINSAVITGNSGKNYRVKKKVKKKEINLGTNIEGGQGLEYAVADYEISGGGEIESLGMAELKANQLDNISSTIKAAGSLNIFTSRLENAAYSVMSPLEYGGGKLYASMGSGSLISGGNINIGGVIGTGKAALINNEISTIRAVNMLEMAAESINNTAVSNINLQEGRGIKATKKVIMPAPQIPYSGGYGKIWYETAEIIHTATQALISARATQIKAGNIINESSIIEGNNSLSIEAESIINRAIMFKDVLEVFYETRGKAEKKFGGTTNEKRNYQIEEEYTFVSQTVGEIKSGGDIEIKLSGNLVQDENSGAIIRSKDNENRVRYSNIMSQDNMSIEAANIYNYGGLQSGLKMEIKTNGDYLGKDAKLIAGSLDLYAGNNFINEARVEYHVFNKPNGEGQFYISSPYVNGYGIFMVTVGDSKIDARNKLTIKGINGIVRGDSNITMKKDGIFDSLVYNLQWRTKVYDRKGTGTVPNKVKGTLDVLGDSVIVSEEGDLNFKGFVRETGGSETNRAGNNYNDEPLELIEKWSYTANEDKLFGVKEKTSREYVKVSNIGSSTKVGGKLEIIAGNNINIMAGSLESLSDIVSLVAGLNINLLAGEDYESSKTAKIKSGMLGINEESESHEESKTTAVATSIKGKGILIEAKGQGFDGEGKMTGGDVTIEGSDLAAGTSGILITAANDVKINTKLEKRRVKDKKEKSNVFTGGEIDIETKEKGTHRGTNMQSGGDILIVAQGNVDSISASYEAAGNAYLVGGHKVNDHGQLEKARNADGSERKGRAALFAAEDYEMEDKYHKKTGGLLDVINPANIKIEFDKGLSASSSYKESVDKSTITDYAAKVNRIEAGDNIKLAGTGDVVSIGSEIFAGKDIDMEAGGNILMSAARNRQTKKSEHEDTTITVGVKVGNAYADVGFAVDAAVKAGEGVAKATDELSKMEKLHKEGKASSDAVEDAKMNLAMASVNMANATISLAASVAGAATAGSSSMGTGMYASGFANYETNKSTSKEETDNARHGILNAGGNINFNSGNNMVQEGTNVYATQGKLSYEIGNDLLIAAGKSTYMAEKKSEQISGGVSVGNNAVQVSAGYGQSSDRMKSTSYTNSESMAKDIVINAKNATLSGANVHAINNLTANIKGNLTVASLQDTYYAKGNSWDASVSVGKGSGSGSFGGGYNQSSNYTDDAWVNRQTTLTGANSVDISVGGKTTLTGAVIGNVETSIDQNTGKLILGEDKGNMNFATGSFEYKDLQDRNKSRSTGFGINTTIGASTDKGKTNIAPSGSTTLSFQNTGSEKKQTTSATLGEGNITIGGESATPSQLAGLNRDITSTQTITYDKITNALDGSITIDNRLLTSEGRKSIAGDFTGFGGNLAKAGAGAFSTMVSPVTAVYSSIKANSNNTEDGENAKYDKKDVISAWKANQSANATAIGRAGQADVNVIVQKIKDGKATPEEIQALANYTSTGKGNLVYSKKGEVVDNTGNVVLGFNDLEKHQGYVNLGNGTATNALEFLKTDAEERAHNYTGNEDVVKRAAKSELGYYNTLSGLIGGVKVGSEDNYGASARQQNWNSTYNTSNNSLLFENTNKANAVKEADRGYSTLAYRGTSSILGVFGIKSEKENDRESSLFGKVFGLTVGTTDKAVERQDNTVYGMQKAGEEYAKIPSDVKKAVEEIKEIPEKLEKAGGEIYEQKEESIKAATDVAGIAGSYLDKAQYASTNPAETANKIGNIADAILFGTIRTGLNNENIVIGMGQVFGGVMNDLALGYGAANLLKSRSGVFGNAGQGVTTVNNYADDAFRYATTYERGSVMGIIEETSMSKFGQVTSKYPEAELYQYNAYTNPGPLAKIGRKGAEPIRNFYGGYYNQKVTVEDMFVYKAGNNNTAGGQYFTYIKPTSAPQVRIDIAVKEQWINPISQELKGQSPLNVVYKYKIPKGVFYYDGPTASQGSVQLGGLNNNNIQIFVPKNTQKGFEVIGIEPLIK